MVIFDKKWKKYKENQLTKNKMDLNIRKITIIHPPLTKPLKCCLLSQALSLLSAAY